jgi:hypothetical protein
MKALSVWAKSMGAEHCRRAQYGAGGGAPCTYSCANAIVLKLIKEKLGLAEVKGAFTAAAPIAPETLLYFASLDLPVYEVRVASPLLPSVAFLRSYGLDCLRRRCDADATPGNRAITHDSFYPPFVMTGVRSE